MVYDIYSRLSAASASLTISVAFSFDTETLRESEKQEMMDDSGGLLHFLPRRHFECYLIDPDAISNFILEVDPGTGERASPEAVVRQLRSAATATAEFGTSPSWNGELSDEKWLCRVDAAKLISHVCEELSEGRVIFSKKKDTLFLLQYLLRYKRAQLGSLIEYVRGLVDATR